MNNKSAWLMSPLFVLLLAFSTFAPAAEPGITVSGAWVRLMPPVAKNSAGYLLIENHTGQADALVSARIGDVRVTELHEMVRDGDTLSMQHRAEIPVPAHGSVLLAPGGLHLMLIDLQKPLRGGEMLAGVLRFRHADDVSVVFEVGAAR